MPAIACKLEAVLYPLITAAVVLTTSAAVSRSGLRAFRGLLGTYPGGGRVSMVTRKQTPL
jgi:hypothetical protein